MVLYYNVNSNKAKSGIQPKKADITVKSEVKKSNNSLTALKAAIEVAENCNNNLPEVMPQMPANTDYNKDEYNSGTSVDRDEGARRQDVRLVKLLYSAVNETLMPYVEEIVDEYEYVGSPIFSDDGIDRETLAQLVDKVIDLAGNDIDEVEEIQDEDITRNNWNRKQLLNSITQSMVLNEIFMVRRPKYRRLKKIFTNSR
jgi:hypothetical protein